MKIGKIFVQVAILSFAIAIALLLIPIPSIVLVSQNGQKVAGMMPGITANM